MKSEESKLYNLRAKIAEARGRQVRKFELTNDAVPGTVFSIGGSINTPRGERYVYVHEWGAYASQEQAYLPPHMNVWDGAGVLLQRSPKTPYEYEIIRTHVSPYPRSMIDGTNIVRASTSDHGLNHQYPTEATVGPDPVLVWMAGIQILKGVADGSNLDVTVGPLYYGLGAVRKFFPTETVDLTPYLPSSGMAVRVLLYLDTATGAIDVVSGAEVAAPGSPTYPDTPYGGIASAYFYLEDTYTTLDMVFDYTDARRWFGAGGSLPLATDEGQMLFSNASNEWVPGKIVTSGGSVVVSNGDVVWSTT